MDVYDSREHFMRLFNRRLTSVNYVLDLHCNFSTSYFIAIFTSAIII